MIISIDIDKALNKIQYPFMIFKKQLKKNFRENRNRGELPQLDKQHPQQTYN